MVPSTSPVKSPTNLYKHPSEAGVYLILHKASNTGYIGSSVNIQARVSHHFCKLYYGAHKYKELQTLYDEDNNSLTVEILYSLPIGTRPRDPEMMRLEGEAICQYTDKINLINHNSTAGHGPIELGKLGSLGRVRARSYLLKHPEIIDQQIEIWTSLKEAVKEKTP